MPRPRGAGCSSASSGRRPGSRGPSADATLAVDRLADRELGSRRSRGGSPRRPPRHVRRPAPVLARRRSRCDARGLRRPPRGGGGGRCRLLANRPPDLSGAARRRPARPRPTRSSRALVREAAAGAAPAALTRVERALEGFRAAPLARRRAAAARRPAPAVRRARARSSTAAGVEDGRVALDFEIQEAITFRDGAAAAFADLESILLRRDAAATRAGQERARDARRRARRGDARRRGRGSRDGRRDRGRGAPPRRDGLPRALARGGRDGRLRRDRRDARPRPGSGGRRASGDAPSRRGSRPTASSSSVPSSGCAGSRRALFQRDRDALLVRRRGASTASSSS